MTATTSVTALPAEPEARTYRLDQLVRLVREGNVRLPHFQRPLRWGTRDAVEFFDSILRGFPIGSLLLWERPGASERITLGDVTIEASAQQRALWVVDGQQRVTTLVNAVDPRAGAQGMFALVYDLRSQPPRVRPAKSDERDSIPLHVLFDLTSVLRWVQQHPELADRIEEINALTTRLREFHIPAYVVTSDDDAVLREIFDRMNNAGKRLSRAEVFSALFAPEEEAAAADEPDLGWLQDYIETNLRWGRVDGDTALRLFLTRRHPDVMRDIHLEAFDDPESRRNDFPGESRSAAYEGAREAVGGAVRFLQSEAGVPHFTFLPYRYLLVVLVRFFAHFPDPASRNRELLRRWFWRAALIGPAISKGNVTGAMRAIGTLIVPGKEAQSVQALVEYTGPHPSLTRPDPTFFRANQAASRIVLCAMWDRDPRSPETGEPFDAGQLSEDIGTASTANGVCREIYPRATLPVPLRASAGNRILLPEVPMEAFEFFLARTSQADQAARARVLASHFLDPSTPRTEAPARVVESRQEVIGEWLVHFLQRMTGEGLDDSPPLDALDLDEDDRDDAAEDG